jgi:hypothetical protein
MRKSQRLNMLELELYKLRIELDILHEVIHGFIQSQETPAPSMDAGKWYPRRLPPQN